MAVVSTMNTLEPLAAIAKTLPALPQDSIESTLLTFGTLVHFGDPEHRPEAACYLREAAEQCGDAARRDRLLRAAGAVIAEEPLALTPEGLTWQQAAAAQTIGIDEWVEPPEPVYPPEEIEEEDEDELEDELEDDEDEDE